MLNSKKYSAFSHCMLYSAVLGAILIVSVFNYDTGHSESKLWFFVVMMIPFFCQLTGIAFAIAAFFTKDKDAEK